MHNFISIARHTDGEVTTSAPEAQIDQLGAINALNMMFELVPHIATLRLYRVDPKTATPIHVETWTREAADLPVPTHGERGW